MKIILSLLCFVLVFQVSAQRKQGSWQDYLSYSNATKLSISSEKIYCATKGGVFYYDLQDNSVSKLSEMVSLSDFGISTIAYSEDYKVLIIAYTNANIDFVYENGEVVNISDIKRKSVTGDKSLNNITVSGNEAFLSCGFGIVVLNIEKQEVKDTYYIGDNGSSLKVNDVDFDDQFIYAATVEGIYKAAKDGVNLLDYNNWTHVDNIPRSTEEFSHLVFFEGSLIANYTPHAWYEDEMYILNGDTWEPYLSQIKFAFDIRQNNGYLTVASRSDVFVVDNTHTIIGKIGKYNFENSPVTSINPRSTVVSADGSVWVADYYNVLVRLSGENFEQICPSGPSDNNVFSLNHSGSALWIAPGATVGYEAPRFQRFNNGEWTYFNSKNHSELDGFHNILAIEVDPADENHIFVASWGGGLLEYRNDEFIQRYTHKNSPLESALPQQPDEPYTRIGGLAFDTEGNLWITNAECAHNLHKLSPAGEWESFELSAVKNKYNLGDVIVNENGDKWMLVLSGHDAYVVDKTGEQKKQLLVTSYYSSGNDEYFTRMNDLYSIAEDLDGAIWIGTSKGIAVYNSPSRIWTSETFYASQPGLDLGDGTYHPLLETETVTAIAVDGANRKWVGTKSSGVFLISETGEQEILHFTAENSALLSNAITAITINQKNGEVFFGTDKGLISYQGEATGGNETYSNVYVYPNPVRETYDGPVTIAGLIENTDVKITDISGNLVYKTTSLGGQAIWDGKNLNGNRVKTGVYLVFCNDKYGEETHITKLLFIN
ncbi:T9SS type A sorting domain-containing protein [Prolixibacteraceae bacterium Z1-6]|uniref:T9SS type A sorting domain-containing protein n=1 Tax=Draconibacterium aestuarii TaxID=2998507 RepID=A0A9X3F5W5_9BACT|nr:T9SS type A sorting domain-containing protein [Prolixibacteraceae bacterium Z1-6]